MDWGTIFWTSNNATFICQAQSGELSAKGSSVEALENGESPVKKPIPARKGKDGGPQASSKLRKLSSQNGVFSPQSVPRPVIHTKCQAIGPSDRCFRSLCHHLKAEVPHGTLTP